MEVSISIIMPVHNTPVQYLTECLDSVVAQTFSDWELIIVDDGSDDSSTIELLRKYANQYVDKIIFLCLEEPLGAGAARNEGLKRATGEYVIFLDSDDVFDQSMLEKMYTIAENRDSDVVVCGYEAFGGNEDLIKNTGSEISANFDKRDEVWMSKMPLNPWTKLVRRGLLLDNNIEFQNISSCNDVFYSIMVMNLAARIYVLTDEYLILYRQRNSGNISSSRNPENIYIAIKAVEERFCSLGLDSEEKIKSLYSVLVNQGIAEIATANDSIQAENCYLKIQLLLRKVSFCNQDYENKRKLMVNIGYDTLWFKHYGDYKYFLNLYRKELMEVVSNQKIYVWGLGKRGQAFIAWAKENSINIEAAYDRQMTPGEVQEQFQLKYMTGNQVLNRYGVIVATNNFIYEEIKNKACGRVVNLEQFCPL